MITPIMRNIIFEAIQKATYQSQYILYREAVYLLKMCIKVFYQSYVPKQYHRHDVPFGVADGKNIFRANDINAKYTLGGVKSFSIRWSEKDMKGYAGIGKEAVLDFVMSGIRYYDRHKNMWQRWTIESIESKVFQYNFHGTPIEVFEDYARLYEKTFLKLYNENFKI